MDSRSPSALLLTKRGVIVLLVASAGVLGAGVGYVLPALNDAPDVAVESEPSTTAPTTDEAATSRSTTAGERTTTGPSRETTAGRIDGGTTAIPSTTTTTADDETSPAVADWWYETDDDSEPSDGTDDDAAVGIHAEANATVASLTGPTRPAVGG